MIHQAKSLIKFLRLSKNKHGVHSPFVYSLVTQCFNDSRKYPAYRILKSHRKALKQDASVITTVDHGQGSRIFKHPDRKISVVYKKVGMKGKRQKLLYRLAAYLKCETMLEFGTSLGLGTVPLALSNEFAYVHTVEACENTTKIAERYFSKFGLSNIQIHQKTFKEFLEYDPKEKYDLIFIDGDHNGERTIAYFNSLLNHIHNNSVIIFDDIYWSKGMTEAWETIRAHEKVTVSIDTFQWGIVFFRKEQRKEHFVIRT
ncbi:class I SAM-dependent methyltransferase [Aequorivita sp. H23M31]|uniref:Class I SAM-dependent methyltransferase n=1 Tax=Aequorivita ciconiae TaxID=2494375 RepID=A0A410G272_9FLAO|nr:class I SAM-dependent methyltransferase [Aequorivita sp. H23M31]QAA81353.1 class I SAM-dependent methyltransferase [Aequorivita sp. H23M31]